MPLLKQTKYSGQVIQEIVAECDFVDEAASSTFQNSSLYATITPLRSPSSIKVSFDVPRADVSQISGSHSERTLAVRVYNETDGAAVGDALILGRVLAGATSAAATSTGSVFATRYCTLTGIYQRTFRLQFAVGIDTLTQARLRGDRGFFRLILQEMETLQEP